MIPPKKWIILPSEQGKSNHLAKELKISPLLAQILINRGISDLQEAQMFLHPKLSNLADPFDIPDIKKAAQRVIQAIEKKENILVYGDYDVDGVTGTAVMLETLKYLSHDPSHYIPYRYDEGYSLNPAAIEKAKTNGVTLIVTVDCGISSHKEIKMANQLGIDVVVTDHHNLPAELPSAYAIVNPKMIKDNHPSKNLSGAGVAFKFVWALLRLLKIKDNVFLTDLLDLVGLGTIADVVPLTGENRILAVAGLNILSQKKRLGIKYLIESAALNGKITIKNVNYTLSPRINAAGRLEHASLSLKLLGSRDPKEAEKIAGELNLINSRRQIIGQKIEKEVFSQIEELNLQKNKIIVLRGNNWHPGVIGIVASRTAEKYSLPVVLIGVQNGRGRGSARSIEGVNIYNLLFSCRDFFIDFGGHESAAGFEIEENMIDTACQRLLEQAEKNLENEALIPKIKIDAEISHEYLTLRLAKEIDVFSPCGEGNPNPVFLSRNLPLEEFRLVGPNRNHLKAKLAGLDVIGFDMGSLLHNLVLLKSYNIVYNLGCNLWNNFENVQLNLLDMRESR